MIHKINIRHECDRRHWNDSTLKTIIQSLEILSFFPKNPTSMNTTQELHQMFKKLWPIRNHSAWHSHKAFSNKICIANILQYLSLPLVYKILTQPQKKLRIKAKHGKVGQDKAKHLHVYLVFKNDFQINFRRSLISSRH